MPDRPLLIVDGDNLAHRAYHSTPKRSPSPAMGERGPGGEGIGETNAISGFFSMLSRIASEEQPRGIFVAWDTLGTDTYRSKLWPPYQTGRVFEPPIVDQLNRLPDLCRAFGFGVGKQAGCEADDLIASACRAEVEQGGTCLILTTDRDSYQLVSAQVSVLLPRPRTRELARIGPVEVVQELGVLPEQVPCFKALCGDASDKIPGAKGIGPKSAASLLLKHGVLEGAVSGLADEEAQRCLMFREVVRMRSDIPVALPVSPPDWAAGAAALAQLGLGGLADRVKSLNS